MLLEAAEQRNQAELALSCGSMLPLKWADSSGDLPYYETQWEQ